jgi:RNA polymerase sigma-32 factor
MSTQMPVVSKTTLDQYFKEINRYPLLSRNDEFELARRMKEEGDQECARRLITANLRFVVKTAFQYRKYQMNMVDLIQEGNLGLMTAVQKFDPYRGYRLISYAVWWIKAYIQNFILRSWSLVKIGTTGQQRKMLFGKRRNPNEFEDETEELTVLPAIASHSATELMQLNTRTARRDFSLDSSLDETARVAYVDLLRADEELQDDCLGREEAREIVRRRIEETVEDLSDRERYILENRILTDEPMTLQAIGDRFNVTRERTRQVESGLKKKLAKIIEEFEEGCPEVSTIV